MKTVGYYQDKGGVLGSRWLLRHSDVRITSVDSFLRGDWDEALSLVCDEQKVVALVNMVRHSRKKQIDLVGVLAPRGFLAPYFKHFGVCEEDSQVYDCSAIALKAEFDRFSDRVFGDHFVRVNAFQEKKIFVMAGGWLTAFTGVGAEGELVLKPLVQP